MSGLSSGFGIRTASFITTVLVVVCSRLFRDDFQERLIEVIEVSPWSVDVIMVCVALNSFSDVLLLGA
jgi:hypothetical protein